MEMEQERVEGQSWVMISGLGRLSILNGAWNSLPDSLSSMVASKLRLLQPRALWICDGSETEASALRRPLIANGTLIPLTRRPNTFLVRTLPADVSRVQTRTYTATTRRDQTEADTVPPSATPALARWIHNDDAEAELAKRFPGSMRGRTCYIVPFTLGPLCGKFSVVGVELTDSAFVVLSLRLLVHVGLPALYLRSGHPVTSCVTLVHSLGRPLPLHRRDHPWECNPGDTIIIHRPEKADVWSFGSGYGGNAILSKTSLALRMATCIGRKGGWLPVHMAVFSLTRLSDGVKRWFGAAFPAGCGKTNLAMLQPSKIGWKVECLSDDVAWLRWNPHTGRLCAINPEAGIYGVAPGTNPDTNPVALDTISHNAILTNVGMTTDGDYYWEGLEDQQNPDAHIHDWHGVLRPLRDPATQRVIGGFAHPNARFAAPLSQCPVAAPECGPDSYGVPLDAIIFGSRRPTHYPLVYEASPHIYPNAKLRHSCSTWLRGTFIAASMRSEVVADEVEVAIKPSCFTAKSDDASSKSSDSALKSSESGSKPPRNIQPEPFAMRPFIGYNFGNFIRDWIRLGEKPQTAFDKGVTKVEPRIYHVNWFREDERTGLLLWPGFGENIRVLEWMMARLDEGASQNGKATKTGELSMLGVVPTPGSLDMADLGVNEELLFEQTWVELGDDVRAAVQWFQEQGGRNFPIRLAICGFQHVGVNADPNTMELFRRGWEHLGDLCEDMTQRKSSGLSASPPVPIDSLRPVLSASASSDHQLTPYVNRSVFEIQPPTE